MTAAEDATELTGAFPLIYNRLDSIQNFYR